MIKGYKIRIYPTPEQEVLFRKSAGVARWSYNYLISERERIYKEYLDNDKQGEKSISEGNIRKRITILKKTTHTWLKEVGCNVIKQAVKDADIYDLTNLYIFIVAAKNYLNRSQRRKSKQNIKHIN